MFNSNKILVIFCLLLQQSLAIAAFDSSIPVIDMRDFHSKARHATFVRDLAHAFETVGFVAVINSGVDIKILDQAYAEAEKFYDLPTEIKMQSFDAKQNGQRGYVPGETAKGNARKDFKEFYHIGRDYAQNIWPTNSKFRPAMRKLIKALDQHVVLIEQAISESIGEDKDFISNMTRTGDYLLRSIHYPANPPADSVWAAAHTDIDLFTILPRATASGLQVLNSDGKWVDVIVPDNAFIINAGDMLQNLTNGRYKSSVHRVVSTSAGVDRYSMVAFIHTRPTDSVGPLTKFIQQDGKRKFADATQRELLSERLVDLGLHSPELLKFLAESKLTDRLLDVNRASPKAMQTLRDANLASPKVLAALGN